ncbi:MAG: DUF6493 family protein [Flavobacteriales bacterium]
MTIIQQFKNLEQLTHVTEFLIGLTPAEQEELKNHLIASDKTENEFRRYDEEHLAVLAVVPYSIWKKFNYYHPGYFLTRSYKAYQAFTNPIFEKFPPSWMNAYFASEDRYANFDNYHQYRYYQDKNWITKIEDSKVVFAILQYSSRDEIPQCWQFFNDFPKEDEFWKKYVPLFFEIETHIGHSIRRKGKKIDDFGGFYSLFLRAVKEGIYSKKQVLGWCLKAMRRPDNKYYVTFFRDVYLGLEPTVEERIYFQKEIMGLYDSEYILNFVLEEVKTMAKSPEFDANTFHPIAEFSITVNTKSVYTKTLQIIKLLLKTNPDLWNSVLIQGLIQTDVKFQENILTLLGKQKLNAEHQEMAEMMAEQIQVSLQNRFQEVFNIQGESTQMVSTEIYQKQTPTFDVLALESVKPIEQWEDFVALLNSFSSSENVVDYEQILQGLIHFHSLVSPEDFTALKPIIKRVSKTNFLSDERTSGTFNKLVFKHIERWTKEWFLDENLFIEYRGTHKLFKKRMESIEFYIHQKSTLPLLSFPTHAPYWVSATRLINRLEEYQNSGIKIAPFDFAVALARCVVPSDFDKKSIDKLQGLPKDLLTYFCTEACLDQFDTSDPLWAVTARTKEPYAIHEALKKHAYANFEAVVYPFKPELMVKEFEDYDGKEIKYDTKANKNTNLLDAKEETLLYSVERCYIEAVSDTPYLQSFMPNHEIVTPLDFYDIVPGVNYAYEGYALERYLHCFYIYGKPVNTQKNYFLAAALLFDKTNYRQLAFETFNEGIDLKVLDLKEMAQAFVHFTQENKTPVKRFTILQDYLFQNVNHDQAFIQLLEEIIQLIETVPKGFKSVLEIYLQLKLKYNQNTSHISSALEKFKTVTSCKKVCNQLINLK